MIDPILRDLGLTPERVSEMLGRTYRPINKTPPTVHRQKGEMHHYSDVTKRRIYNLRMMGKTYREISAMTGISARDAQLLFAYLKSTGSYAKEPVRHYEVAVSLLQSSPLADQSASQVHSVLP